MEERRRAAKFELVSVDEHGLQGRSDWVLVGLFPRSSCGSCLSTHCFKRFDLTFVVDSNHLPFLILIFAALLFSHRRSAR